MDPKERDELIEYMEKHYFVLPKRFVGFSAAVLTAAILLGLGANALGLVQVANEEAREKAKALAAEFAKEHVNKEIVGNFHDLFYKPTLDAVRPFAQDIARKEATATSSSIASAVAQREAIEAVRKWATTDGQRETLNELFRIEQKAKAHLDSISVEANKIKSLRASLGPDQPRLLAAGRVDRDGNIQFGQSVGLPIEVKKDTQVVGRYFMALPSNYEHQDTYMIAIPATHSRRQRITVGWSRQHNGYVVNTTDNSQEQSLVAVRADSDFFFVLVGKHGQSERTAETEEDSQLGT
ncbi:MAG: hypothetical protein ACFCBV_08290 [Phycisphaerales bacterium]